MNAEWDSLSELWVSSRESIAPDALRRVVRSHRRTLLFVTAGEAALAVVLLALTFSILGDGIEPWELVWAATLWLFLGAATLFVWWNRRGTWETIGESVADYVRLTRLRAGRGLRSLRFAIALYVAEIVAITAQLLWFDRFTPRSLLILGATIPTLAIWIFFARRKINRDLAVAEEFSA